MSAIDLSESLLERFGGLGPLLKADQNSFCAAKGLGLAKYCQLQATLELTQRYLGEQLQHKPKQKEDYLAPPIPVNLTLQLRNV
jgi:DNA repair protein RadC